MIKSIDQRTVGGMDRVFGWMATSQIVNGRAIRTVYIYIYTPNSILCLTDHLHSPSSEDLAAMARPA
jgi:hypothetical protein